MWINMQYIAFSIISLEVDGWDLWSPACDLYHKRSKLSRDDSEL